MPQAEADLDGIYAYIADVLHNPPAADKFYDGILHGCESLSVFPNGCPVDPMNGNYRFLLVGNYKAFYIVDEPDKTVYIFRVLYGASDYVKLLKL
jgi:plasmid stabilization system protein ParE